MIEKVSKNYISKEKIHSILFPKQTQTNQNYFYADIPNPQGGTIRIISLDMLDQPGTDIIHAFMPTIHKNKSIG